MGKGAAFGGVWALVLGVEYCLWCVGSGALGVVVCGGAFWFSSSCVSFFI